MTKFCFVIKLQVSLFIVISPWNENKVLRLRSAHNKTFKLIKFLRNTYAVEPYSEQKNSRTTGGD